MAESPDLTALSHADRHRAVAAGFDELVRSTSDWSAPSPVSEWCALDIVSHLLEWFPEFLAAGGVELRGVRWPPDDGPGSAWADRTSEIQGVLDDRDTVDRIFVHPFAGTHRLGEAIDRFYTTDAFMHTWDLARSAGGHDRLDPAWSAELLTG